MNAIEDYIEKTMVKTARQLGTTVKRLLALAQKHHNFKAQQSAGAFQSVREETPTERGRRLRLGWDWRKGNASVRLKAKKARA